MHRAAPALLLIACLACGRAAPLPTPKDVPACTLELAEPLAVGSQPPRYLAPGAHHCYRIDLPAGAYLRATASQTDGFDLVWDLASASGHWLMRFDAVADGDEPLDWIHKGKTPLLLILHELDDHPGTYRLNLTVSPSPTARDIERARALRDFSMADSQYSHSPDGMWLEQMSRAIDRLAATGDSATEAALLFRLADLLQGPSPQAIDRIAERLIDLQDEFGTPRRQAYARIWAAWNSQRGSALLWAEKARDLGRALSNSKLEAFAHQRLGAIHQWRGEPGAAERSYERAIELFASSGEHLDTAETLMSLAKGRAQYADIDSAQETLERAIQLIDSASGNADRARTKLRIQLHESQAELAYATQHWPEAHQHYSTALELATATPFAALRASVQDGLARASARLGRTKEAEHLFARAIEGWYELEEMAQANTVRTQRAYERLQRGETAQALRDYGQLCPIGRERGDDMEPLTWASCKLGLGRIARQRGDLPNARLRMREAFEEYRRHRDQADQLGQRQHLAAQRHHYAEELIDVLLQLDREQVESPSSIYREEAFAVSEWAHARSLRDHLRNRAGLPLAQSEDPSATNSAQLGSLLTLAQAQELAAREDALILQFDLGPSHSYLWAFDARHTHLFLLPRGEELRERVAKYQQAIERSDLPGQSQAARQAAREASDLLLGPIADLLHDQPVWIIAQGNLDAFPFAALPIPVSSQAKQNKEEPSGTAALLVEHHSILRPPSISSIDWLRTGSQQRNPSHGKILAVVAAPAYPEGSGYAELSGAREEAHRIAALVPAPAALLLTGEEANVSNILAGALNDARYIHIATHAEAPPRQEYANLVLSPEKAKNSDRAGHLYSPQIAELPLSAELVVLAGCDTGLGEKLAGENLQGLTQAFFRAGVPRVLVSLWPIEDRATAHFMERFYSRLLGGATPAEALQATQIEFIGHPKWHAPTYWAAFALRGLP